MLDIDGYPVNRCYTISSPPTRPHRLAITVKRVLGGTVSNWVHDNVVPGSKVSAMAPLGAFTLARQPADKYLFLSAGSGITPLMSMIRTMYDLGSDADVVFLHSARTPSDIVFRSELAAIEMHMPNLRVVHVCEADYPSERWAACVDASRTPCWGRRARPAGAGHVQLRTPALHGFRTPHPR